MLFVPPALVKKYDGKYSENNAYYSFDDYIRVIISGRAKRMNNIKFTPLPALTTGSPG